jgi:hypothetical protein
VFAMKSTTAFHARSGFSPSTVQILILAETIVPETVFVNSARLATTQFLSAAPAPLAPTIRIARVPARQVVEATVAVSTTCVLATTRGLEVHASGGSAQWTVMTTATVEMECVCARMATLARTVASSLTRRCRTNASSTVLHIA